MSKFKSMTLLALFLTGCADNNSNASIAARQASQASVMASSSAVHAVAASGQVLLGASSVPLAIGGAASTAMATASMNAASRKPLPVTDQTITVIPPNQALQK